jgi:hypothetical protein
VADIIDLGTVAATVGFALAAAGAGVSGPVSGFGRVGGHELTYQAGERLRHLIGKRHHAS